MLPFIYADMKMAPAGVRAIGSALTDCGFEKTRIVLQQWNKNFQPSAMKLDGRVPDLFLVSSMHLHTECAQDMMKDARTIAPPHRPLIVAGGAGSVYEPWNMFSGPRNIGRAGADLVVTGEEFVFLQLLEVLLTERAGKEPLREAFKRCRASGALDEIPGIYYARVDEDDLAVELVDTGVQRLLGDLDELPHPKLGYRLLEPPSRGAGLGAHALPAHRVKKYTPIASLIMTFGCKFRCPYCPIPAYNQRLERTKSPKRIADELVTLHKEYGMRLAFGTDDNFFNNHARTIEICEELSNTRMHDGARLRRRIRWATEATVHDTLKLRDHMPIIRGSGLRGIWMGVEDMTATVVKKGQSVDNTTEAFQLLSRFGIQPNPMMMHHDGQPLYTWGKPYGLLNQARMLRKAGAVTFQVLMLSPATGSKLYEGTYNSGMVIQSANEKPVRQHMRDANYVFATHAEKPWRMQVNMVIAYAYFYNPLRFLWALVRPRSRLYFADSIAQAAGMRGFLQTLRRTVPWAWNLWRGPIVREDKPPLSAIPMVSVLGGRAEHALEAQAAAKGPVSEPDGQPVESARSPE